MRNENADRSSEPESFANRHNTLSAQKRATTVDFSERTTRRTVPSEHLRVVDPPGAENIQQTNLQGDVHTALPSRRPSNRRSQSASSLHVSDALTIPPRPQPLTTLIGREAEAVAVTALLREQQVRLLTLTGPGGIGKTRLALQVANEVESSFCDGVAYITLASISTPELVLPTIARLFDVRESGEQSLAEQLIAILSPRELLLIVDNVEHVLAAAPLITELLAACPNVAVLATSRARLNLGGEHIFPVPPLSLPVHPHGNAITTEAIAEADAVRLFVARSKAVAPTFALTSDNAEDIATICHRLDGLPLAIELAAARVQALPPRVLLQRLNQQLALLIDGPQDAPARLRTMRDAIAWSYNLLDPADQVLFRHLAVFADGFTLEAATAVMGQSDLTSSPSTISPSAAVLDGITSLVNKSLIRSVGATSGSGTDSPRFGMLETIREFALEQLTEADEEPAARRRHALYYVALAEEAEPALLSADDTSWLARLTTENAEFLSAQRWATEHGEPVLALRLGYALRNFWYRGVRHPRVAFDAFEQALAAADQSAVPPLLRAKTLNALGWLAIDLGRFDTAVARLEQAITLWHSLEDRRQLATALHGLGAVAEFRGDDTTATARYEDALALHREFGQHPAICIMLENLADVAYRGNDLARAATLSQEALALARAPDIPSFVVLQALVGAAQVTYAQSDLASASGLLHEALNRAETVSDLRGMADALSGCAAIALANGQAAQAASLLGAVTAVTESLGAYRLFHHAWYVQTVAATSAALDAETYAAAQATGRALSLDETVMRARAILTSHVDAAEALSSSSKSCSPKLSQRELAVLHLLVEGRGDAEIAEALFISRKTVSNHVAAIIEKLGVANRTAAATLAVRQGLV